MPVFTFHRSQSDDNSPLVSRTVLSILADFNSAVASYSSMGDLKIYLVICFSLVS